jgi:hypothetical protein
MGYNRANSLESIEESRKELFGDYPSADKSDTELAPI